MPKTPAKHGQPWRPEDDSLLRRLARENTPTRVAALKLERRPGALQQRASAIGLSLKPVNQSPNKGRCR